MFKTNSMKKTKIEKLKILNLRIKNCFMLIHIKINYVFYNFFRVCMHAYFI